MTGELYLFDLCRIDNCGRLVRNKTQRLCQAHYTRFWRYGDPLAGGPMRPNAAVGRAVQDFPDGTRICHGCEERKPIDLFHKDSGGTGGRRAYCAECHKAKARQWYAANRERQASRQLARRQANPEQHRQWDMERYERHRAKRIELATEHSHKRRIRILAGDYDRTVTRANLRKQYGDHCFYCAIVMDFNRYTHATRPMNLATIEHVVAVSRGGSHTWDNVVLACLSCNVRKNAKALDDWLESA